MLKGKVCIDLHNHKSGFTERIEGENLITDALSMFVNYMAVSGQLSKSGDSPVYPLATKALGGICLIDKNFSQGGDIFIPGNAKYIGGGSYNFNDTQSKYIGTYNLLESGWNESTKTFKHVYDYSASQANGNINGIALTTQNAGKNGFVPRMQGNAIGEIINAHTLYVDTENRDIYYITPTSATANPIYRLKYPLDVLPLYQGSEPVDTGKTIDYNGELYVDGLDGYIYEPRVNGNTLYLRQVNVSDLSFDYEGEISITFPATLYFTPDTRIAINMDVGYVYALSQNATIIYRYNVNEDTTYSYDVSQMFGEGFISSLEALPNGEVVGAYRENGTDYPFRINTDNGVDFEKIVYPNSVLGMQSILSNGVIYYINVYATPGRTPMLANASMLMSNYNLPETVVKTQAQSMRVSYSIAQV